MKKFLMEINAFAHKVILLDKMENVKSAIRKIVISVE